MEELNIICPFYCKRYLLESLSKEDKLKFYLPSQVISSLTYSYDVKGVYYVYEKYAKKNLAYAEILIQNAALLKDSIDPSEEKISLLQEIRLDLIKRGFFVKDSLTLFGLKRRKVVLYGLEGQERLKSLLADSGIEFEERKILGLEQKPKDLLVYEDSRIEDTSLLNSVGGLLKEGIMPTQIGVCCPEGNMSFIDYLFCLAGIKVTYPGLSLNETPYYSSFVRDYEEKGLKEPEEEKEAYPISIRERILSFLEETEGIDSKDFILAYLKEKGEERIPSGSEGILLSSSLTSIVNKDYPFIINFTSSYLPPLKDKDLLNDEEKRKYSYADLSSEKSQEKKNDLILGLLLAFRKEGSRISYSLSDPIQGQNEENVLAKEDSLFHLVKADGEENFEKRYSLKGDLLLLASLKADNANYGSESLLLRDLKANLDSLYVPYHPDNQHPEYHESLKKLSFSSLTDFARCPYSYLIKRIYQIQDEEDENLNLPKGTFFHYLVETHEKGEDVSEEEALDACRIDKSKLAEKDAFYFHKIFLSAQLFCQELDQMKDFAGLDSQVKAELPFEYSLNNGEILKGKIDAVLIGPKDYLILDYKTGEHLFSYDEALIGLDMQLPLYASALKRNEELKGKTDVGFLFAMPFPKKFLYSFVPAMTLSGCYSLDEKGAKLIFSFASDSERLGTYISSRANKSSPLTMEQLIEKVEGQINLLSSRIQEGKFPVVQKRLVKSNGETSKEFCQFCPYLDCCYLDTDDERQVEKVPLIRDAGEEEEEQ